MNRSDFLESGKKNKSTVTSEKSSANTQTTEFMFFQFSYTVFVSLKSPNSYW